MTHLCVPSTLHAVRVETLKGPEALKKLTAQLHDRGLHTMPLPLHRSAGDAMPGAGGPPSTGFPEEHSPSSETSAFCLQILLYCNVSIERVKMW